MALTREQAWDLLNEYNKGEFHLKQPDGQGICISKLCRNTCDAAGEHPLRYNQGKLHWSRKQAGTLRDCKWGNVIS